MSKSFQKKIRCPLQNKNKSKECAKLCHSFSSSVSIAQINPNPKKIVQISFNTPTHTSRSNTRFAPNLPPNGCHINLRLIPKRSEGSFRGDDRRTLVIDYKQIIKRARTASNFNCFIAKQSSTSAVNRHGRSDWTKPDSSKTTIEIITAIKVDFLILYINVCQTSDGCSRILTVHSHPSVVWGVRPHKVPVMKKNKSIFDWPQARASLN